jgi:hypothetical protein
MVIPILNTQPEMSGEEKRRCGMCSDLLTITLRAMDMWNVYANVFLNPSTQQYAKSVFMKQGMIEPESIRNALNALKTQIFVMEASINKKEQVRDTNKREGGGNA